MLLLRSLSHPKPSDHHKDRWEGALRNYFDKNEVGDHGGQVDVVISMQSSRTCLLLKKLASDKICEITMNGSSVSKCLSMLRIGSSHNCMLMFNSSICSRNHVADRPIPNLRYCSSDLKFRGLRSLEKYIDVRQGEILTAEMFESKMLAAKTPSRIKKSIFTVKKEYADLPAETQLQSRNRNPRNMELLGYNKPRGYGTLYKKRDFWNRYSSYAIWIESSAVLFLIVFQSMAGDTCDRTRTLPHTC